MPITEAHYLRMGFWEECTFELYQGRLTEKGGGTAIHNDVTTYLGLTLYNRMERVGIHELYDVRINGGRLRESAQDFYVPDVFIFPTEYSIPLRDKPDVLEVYSQPVTLVCEVWMPPIDGYDHDYKLAAYRRRGDQEVWRVDPYDRIVTSWSRRIDGSYAGETHRGGTVEVGSLPGVAIDLDVLFE